MIDGYRAAVVARLAAEDDLGGPAPELRAWWPCAGWGEAPRWMVHGASGLVYPSHCGRWDCRDCAAVKRAAAALVIERGIRALHSDRRRVRFFTFTSAPDRGVKTVADLLAAWRKLSRRLSHLDKLGPYWASVETTQAGALHLHVVMGDPVGGDGFVDNRRDRTYLGKRRPRRGDIPVSRVRILRRRIS